MKPDFDLSSYTKLMIVGGGMSDEPGRGTLLLVGALIDVVSEVPPVDECVGRCDVHLTEVGEATLVMELPNADHSKPSAPPHPARLIAR